MMIRSLYVLSWMLILAGESAWTAEDSALFLAQEGEDQVLPSQGGKVESNSIQENEGLDDSTQSTEPQPKKKQTRVREAEGTRALNRFESEIIIKSRYELNGQPLEVDTD